MSTTPFRVGVVGNGSISVHHLNAYAADARVELVAVADINLDRAKAAGEKYGATAYGDAAELYALDEVDAVSICTPNNTHVELAVAAIEAGKHVLLEKPMSHRADEAQRLADLVAGQDKVLQIGLVRRHSTNYKVLKSFIDAGDLGDIYYAKAACIRQVGNPGGWFANKETSGGGPLIDLGVHVIDLAWSLMGCPRPVTVSGNTYHHLGGRDNVAWQDRYRAADAGLTNDVEDLANAMIRFENGASLMVETSFSLHTVENSLAVSVHGTSGGASLEPLEIVGERHDTVLNMTPQIRSNRFGFTEAFSNEIAHFVSSCLGEEEQVAPAWQGAMLQQMLGAIYESAANGTEVKL
ncbi:Gfo/Idh/MocA family protein [Propionibacteriaceae bacterium Y2011]